MPDLKSRRALDVSSPGAWSASGNPRWGRGLWGQLHPPGGVSLPRREVTLPPGMDEEVGASGCPRSWAKLQASRDTMWLLSEGWPSQTPPPWEMGFLGAQEPVWAAGSGGQVAQLLCPALAQTGH